MALKVGVLSLSKESVVQPLLEILEKNKGGKINPIFIKLTAEDLDKPHYEVTDKVEAVVLVHSIMEGRFSVTDVPDARYNRILPSLSSTYGTQRVVVIAHAMPNFSDKFKHIQMKVFIQRQPLTFQCSDCVILCGSLAEMPEQDSEGIIEFLIHPPKHSKPHSADALTLPNRKEKARMSGSQFMTGVPDQAGHPKRRNDRIGLAMVTSEKGSKDAESIKKCIYTYVKSYGRDIVIPYLQLGELLNGQVENVHAFLFFLDFKKIIREGKLWKLVCDRYPPGKREYMRLLLPLRYSQLEGEFSGFERIEYETRGTSEESYLHLSDETMRELLSWLDHCVKSG